MDLYHADIRLPAGFRAPTGRVALAWSSHAKRARMDDRYAEIPEFRTATLDSLRIIEVGVENGRVAKIVYRGRFTANLDVVMVLVPNTRGPWFVKTVWLNEKNDSHRTLDRSKYVC